MVAPGRQTSEPEVTLIDWNCLPIILNNLDTGVSEILFFGHSIPFRSLPKVKRNKMRHVPNESPIYGILTPWKNEIFLSPPFEINRVDPTKFWKSKNIFVDLYYFYTQKISHQLFSQKFFIPWIWTQLSLMVGLRFLKFFDWEEEIG